MLTNPFRKIRKRKTIIFILSAILILVGYLGYQEIKPAESSASYVTETTQKGMLISSISGTGQVSALDQVDIKPKVSGEVVAVNIKSGQEVKTGDLIAQIDSRDAAIKVSEAQASLEITKLELEELLEPTDTYTLLQAENALADTRDSLAKLKFKQETDYQEILKSIADAKGNLIEAYDDGFNTVADVFLDLPDIMTGLQNILFSNGFSSNQWNIDYYTGGIDKYNSKASQYKNDVYNNYQTARSKYEENLENYKNASRYSENIVIENLVEETYQTVKAIAEAIKETINLIDVYRNEMSSHGLTIPSLCTSHKSDLNSYTGQTNNQLSSLSAIKKDLENNKDAIINAERDLEEMKQNNPLDLAAAERGLLEKEEKLADLKVGASEIEIRNKKISVQQKINALTEAQQNLADCYIRAPFDGLAAEVNVKKGETISSGNIIASLITTQKIAEITLNEIDAAQVKVGQKVTLEFDAVENLSITGEVAEIDTLGTVSQGVVSYDIKIAFDVQDERIKPGMSVSATIITKSKSNVLLISSSAVKTQGDLSYVEILVNGQPQTKTVVTGSSNDTMIEIVEGLEEGEEIITQTVLNSSGESNSSSQNRQTGTGGFGGEFRMLR